jgi:hypothetical protein
MRPFEDYQRELTGITLEEAVTLLQEIGYDKERIILRTPTGNFIGTPMSVCFKLPGKRLANTIGPIEFCGGPPGRVRWVIGTLETFVLDKMMTFDADAEIHYEIYGTKVATYPLGC